MANCLIMQVGEPNVVMNASLVGVINGCKKYKYYDNAYGLKYGLDGLKDKAVLDLYALKDDDLSHIKNTPGAYLGLSHYALKAYDENDAYYDDIASLMEENEVESVIIIGNNTAMAMVYYLNQYFEKYHPYYRVIGVPSDFRNEIYGTDHSPGYASAANYIAKTTAEIAYDAKVFQHNGIYIIETMGHESGWLAASSILAMMDDDFAVDFIYIPEMNFIERKCIDDIAHRYSEKKRVIVVVAEGLKDLKGKNVGKCIEYDAVLGCNDYSGAAEYLKRRLIEQEISSNVKIVSLGVTQRIAMHMASDEDLIEAFEMGVEAVHFTMEDRSGAMVSVRRLGNHEYSVSYEPRRIKGVPLTRHYPIDWVDMLDGYVTQDFLEYIRPLLGD